MDSAPRPRFDVTCLGYANRPFYLCRHSLIHYLWLEVGNRYGSVFIHHMPSPIILPGEVLASFPRLRATGLRTVISPSLQGLIVDMPVKVGLRSELLAAPWMCA